MLARFEIQTVSVAISSLLIVSMDLLFHNTGGNSNGGVNEAWRCVGEEMEAAAEAHRLWGIALSEQLAKPLRVSLRKMITTIKRPREKYWMRNHVLMQRHDRTRLL